MSCVTTLESKVPNPTVSARRCTFRNLPLLLPALFMLASVPTTVMSASSGLQGAWRGHGWVSFSSGRREQAHCRIHFSEQSSRSFALSATCATESGRVSQNAMLRKAGGNAYVGSFYNSEFDISGTIRLTMHGGTPTARLVSRSGSAYITLSR